MKIRRVKRYIGEVLFWVAVVAFFVVASIRLHSTEQAQRVTAVEIEVRDSLKRGYVTPSVVHALLQESELYPVGKLVDEVELSKISDLIEGIDYITEVNTYCDFEGVVTVSCSQLTPRVRIRTNQGHDFYLTDELVVLPVQEHFSLNLPIVTGTLPLPFEADFTGNVKELEREEEKNYEENYNFLTKLIKFVDLTETDSKYRGKIVQIVVATPDTSDGKWREPTVELVPREGNYLVKIGPLSDVEAKLARWERFVAARVVELDGGVLNVEYENQALWREKPKNKKRK